LSAIFGSRAAVDVLRFSLNHGIADKIYQKDLVEELDYSNKTVIENLKSMTKLGVLKENMEKAERNGRVVWVKSYELSDTGKWFALLLAEDKDLSRTKKAEILQSIFTAYVRWLKNISEKLQIDRKTLEKIFMKEMG
jgi:predicted transcriptional regulator